MMISSKIMPLVSLRLNIPRTIDIRFQILSGSRSSSKRIRDMYSLAAGGEHVDRKLISLVIG